MIQKMLNCYFYILNKYIGEDDNQYFIKEYDKNMISLSRITNLMLNMNLSRLSENSDEFILIKRQT